MTQFIAGLLMPVSVFFLAILCAFILSKSKHKRAALYINLAAFLWLYFIASPITMIFVVENVESHHRGIALDSDREYDAIVVLGGYTSEIKRGNQTETQALPGIDRLFTAYSLFKQGYSDTFVLTGGTSFPGKETPEAERVFNVLTYFFEADTTGMLLETQSVNTIENARFTKQLLDSHGIGTEVILVTSVTHMKRAVWSFEQEDFTVHPVATDFATMTRSALRFPGVLIPSAEAMAYNSKVFREAIGRLFYRLAY